MARATTVHPTDAASKRRHVFARTIERRVRDFIEQRDVIRRGERVLVAVSGGGDSTAMMLILSRLAPRFGWHLTTAHFDHRLRSREEAAGDLAFVSGLSQSLGFPFVHGNGDVARRARTHGESVEQAARALRYRFLASRARDVGASAVVAGHTLDDQAETVLLHLIRGSGLDGLAGMRPRSAWPTGRGPEVARPLLALRREETGRYCRELGIEPREDPTNELLLATRNRVRHEVLPVLRLLNPRVDEALVRLAEAAAEDAEALDGIASDAARGVGRLRKGAFELGIEALGQLRPAIRARALRLALSRVLRSKGDIEAAHVEALDRLVDSRPGRASLAHGLVAVRDSRSLTIYRGEPPVSPVIQETPLVVPGVTEAGGWSLEAEYVAQAKVKGRGRFEAYLDAEAVSGGLRVRSRRPGDRMRPLGLSGEKKLQDILVDAKVARDQRDGVPVIATEWGIAWVVGVCLDERAAAGGGMGRAVRVRAQRPAQR